MARTLRAVPVWSRRFAAMGTTAEVRVVGGEQGLLDLAQDAVAAAERRWSRFLPDSDVTRLNEGNGAWVGVDPSTLEILATALTAEEATGGRFSVLVERDMAANGYSRPFHEGPCPVASGPSRVRGRLELDAAGRAARVTAGAGVDLGGIAKGWTADHVAVELRRAGALGALVDLGGDVRVTGVAPGGQGWTVDVVHPSLASGADDVLATTTLVDGAVATSSVLRRRWARPDGTVAHHVVDPASGAPAAAGLVGATCVAATAVHAEVVTKAVLVGGAAYGRALLAAWGLDGVLVSDDGVTDRVELIGCWHEDQEAA